MGEDKKEEYKKYLKDKIYKEEYETIQSFKDFCYHNIGQWSRD